MPTEKICGNCQFYGGDDKCYGLPPQLVWRSPPGRSMAMGSLEQDRPKVHYHDRGCSLWQLKETEDQQS